MSAKHDAIGVLLRTDLDDLPGRVAHRVQRLALDLMYHTQTSHFVVNKHEITRVICPMQGGFLLWYLIMTSRLITWQYFFKNSSFRGAKDAAGRMLSTFIYSKNNIWNTNGASWWLISQANWTDYASILTAQVSKGNTNGFPSLLSSTHPLRMTGVLKLVSTCFTELVVLQIKSPIARSTKAHSPYLSSSPPHKKTLRCPDKVARNYY